MSYRVTKIFPHELGLCAVFRQHRAESHCRFLHGYALSFSFTFVCDQLDKNGWVVDFGSFNWLREWLRNTFDHKTIIALDDPLAAEKETILALGKWADVYLVAATGAEAFAKMAFDHCKGGLAHYYKDESYRNVRIVAVEVCEHGANSAVYSEECPAFCAERKRAINAPQ